MPENTRLVWTVGALLQAVADSLRARFNPVAVSGEVSGFARAASGHCYFNLKDAQGQLRCAMFRRAAQLSAIDWRDGLQIEAQGRLDVYGARGELQLVVESARPSGQGNLYEQFLRLKAQLEQEGCFDAARKRPMPRMPRALAVVTSPDAAALHDVLSTLARRSPHVAVTLYPALVQGEAAPASLCRALSAAGADRQAQAVLLVRGGGSLEDLWSFNHPDVVRAVVACPLPVICGVGHETDVTLADFAADLRAPTPTAAAEMAAPLREALLAQLDAQQQRLQRAVWRRIEAQGQHLDRLGERMGRPSSRLAASQRQLQGLGGALSRAVALRLQRASSRLDLCAQRLPEALARDRGRRQQSLAHAADRLALLDPALVLQRGYAWLSDASGRALVSAAAVSAGDAVQARLADGTLDMTVRAVRP